MTLVAERQSAIHLLRSGKTVAETARHLQRSESWVRKWQARYQQEGWDGLKGRSTRPHHSPRALSDDLKATIRQVRSELEALAASGQGLKYIGGQAIRTRLKEMDITPLPSLTSIERVIRQTGMTRPYQRMDKQKVEYPHLKATHPQELMQVDIVPHYLKGGERVACFNAIDVVSRYPAGKAYSRRRSVDAAAFLLHAWQELGVPTYTQVDNEGCFSGGATHPHVLGRVLRLALQAGTELIFSPVYHPQSNGFVERFHQDYNKHVWQDTYLDSIETVQAQAENFFALFRKRPRRQLQEQTPLAVHQAPKRLPKRMEVTAEKRQLVEGKVHFIRRVLDDNTISVLNASYPLPQAKVNAGVWVTLKIRNNGSALHVFDSAPDVPNRKLLASFPFLVTEPITRREAA